MNSGDIFPARPFFAKKMFLRIANVHRRLRLGLRLRRRSLKAEAV
jgi:hypothetical protein